MVPFTQFMNGPLRKAVKERKEKVRRVRGWEVEDCEG